MKNIAVICCLSLILLGCEKANRLTQFQIDFTENVEITPTNPFNLPFNLFTPDVETNSETEFEINDTRKDLIEEIILKTLKLTLTGPEEGDFSFLKSIEIFLNAEDLPELKVAWAYDIGEDVGKILKITTSEEDIKEYIKKDKFTMRLNTITDEVIDERQYIEVYSDFYVDAKLIR